MYIIYIYIYNTHVHVREHACIPIHGFVCTYTCIYVHKLSHDCIYIHDTRLHEHFGTQLTNIHIHMCRYTSAYAKTCT